ERADAETGVDAVETQAFCDAQQQLRARRRVRFGNIVPDKRKLCATRQRANRRRDAETAQNCTERNNSAGRIDTWLSPSDVLNQQALDVAEDFRDTIPVDDAPNVFDLVNRRVGSKRLQLYDAEELRGGQSDHASRLQRLHGDEVEQSRKELI